VLPKKERKKPLLESQPVTLASKKSQGNGVMQMRMCEEGRRRTGNWELVTRRGGDLTYAM
jgi:hypothetical protein